MKLIVDVINCLDCPCKNQHIGHGECWYYCRHIQAPKGYDNILWGCGESFKSIPKWCPLDKD